MHLFHFISKSFFSNIAFSLNIKCFNLKLKSLMLEAAWSMHKWNMAITGETTIICQLSVLKWDTYQMEFYSSQFFSVYTLWWLIQWNCVFCFDNKIWLPGRRYWNSIFKESFLLTFTFSGLPDLSQTWTFLNIKSPFFS